MWRGASKVSAAFDRRTSRNNEVFQGCEMRIPAFLLVLCVCYSCAQNNNTSTTTETPTTSQIPIGCVCGVFLSNQVKRGSKEPPKGNAALLHEHPDAFPCNNFGKKLCTNRCLDVIVKHLPNSPAILCGAIDRNAYKERAHLFIKNCKNEWINTNLSAGREYCCKDGKPHKCSIMR